MIAMSSRRVLLGAGVGLVLLYGLFVACAGRAGASPGDLDRSFARNGILHPRMDLGSPYTYQEVLGIAVGPENAIFLLERGSCATSCAALFVARYKPGGTLDRSFGGGPGVAEAISSPVPLNGASLAVDGKGRPLIAVASPQGLTVRRLTRDGRPDPSFGSGGEAVATTSDKPQSAWLLIGANGELTVAGSWLGEPVYGPQSGSPTYPTELLIARFSSSGSLDGSFATSGAAQLRIASRTESLEADALLPDGSSVFATGGFSQLGPGFSRITDDGALDTGYRASLVDAFAGMPQQPEFWLSLVSSLIPRGRGSLDAFGYAARLGRGYAVRFGPDGSSDRRFGRRGAHLLPFLVGDAVKGAGGTVFGSGYSSALGKRVAFRLRADDSVDRTFAGSEGFALPGTDGRAFEGDAVAVGPSDRPVLFDPGLPECIRGPCGPADPRIFRFLGGVSHSRCFGRRATIVGTRRADVLDGTDHRDVIAALGGNDWVEGGGGNDLICGGRGSDTLVGGPGRDRIRE